MKNMSGVKGRQRFIVSQGSLSLKKSTKQITEIGKIRGSALAEHLLFPALSFTGTTAVDLWLRIRELWLPDQESTHSQAGRIMLNEHNQTLLIKLVTVQAYLMSTSGAEMRRLPASERRAKGPEDIPQRQIPGRSLSFQSTKPLWVFYKDNVTQGKGNAFLKPLRSTSTNI